MALFCGHFWNSSIPLFQGKEKGVISCFCGCWVILANTDLWKKQVPNSWLIDFSFISYLPFVARWVTFLKSGIYVGRLTLRVCVILGACACMRAWCPKACEITVPQNMCFLGAMSFHGSCGLCRSAAWKTRVLFCAGTCWRVWQHHSRNKNYHR